MSQLSYLLDRARDSAETGKKQERRSRSRLRDGLRKLPLTSYRRVVDASLAQSLTALRSWLTRRLQQGEAHAELRRELDAEFRLRAQAMRATWQEAEERARTEIALRIQAEQKARQEAESRLEIERMARREAERRIEKMVGPLRDAHPETIAKAESEMIARVQAEQLAISKSRAA
jgi:predicted metal-dependent hydrolase